MGINARHSGGSFRAQRLSSPYNAIRIVGSGVGVGTGVGTVVVAVAWVAASGKGSRSVVSCGCPKINDFLA